MEFDEEIFQVHSEFCSVFSNVIRMKIFWILKQGESSVSELAEAIGVSVQNISQHLRLMKDKGAVTIRKDGKQIYYKIANSKFVKGASLIREGILDELKKKSVKFNV